MQTGRLISGNILWRGVYLVTIFITNILLSRYLGAAESGWIFFTINNLSFLILAGSLSLESGITYFGASSKIPLQQLATTSIIWSVIATIIITIVFLVLPTEGVQLLHGNTLLLCILVYVWGVLLTTYCCSLFYARQSFIRPNQVMAVINLLLVIFLLLLPVYNNQISFLSKWLPIVYFLSFLVQGIGILIAWQIRSKQKISFALPRRDQLSPLWKYLRIVLLTNIVFFLVYRVDYWLVALYCTPAQLGNYIQVSKIGQVFLLLPGMVATVIFPLTAGDANNRMADQLPVVSRTIFLIYFAAILGLIACGQWLFPFLYGNTFTDMYAAFAWLGPGIIALSIQALLTAYYSGKNKLINNLQGAVLALVIIVPGDLLMIPRFGINGAAMVSSLGYIAYMIFMINRFMKDHSAGVADFFIPRKTDAQRLKAQLFNKKAAEI